MKTVKLSDKKGINRILLVDLLEWVERKDVCFKHKQEPIVLSLFNPMEKLEDAFLVLESLKKEKGIDFKLSSSGRWYRCEISNGWQGSGVADGSTIQEAVCLALLDYASVEIDYRIGVMPQMSPIVKRNDDESTFGIIQLSDSDLPY